MVKIIAVVVLGCFLIACIWYLYSAWFKADQELTALQIEADQAKEALAEAAAHSADVRAHLQKLLIESQANLAESNKQIESLEKSLAYSARQAAALSDQRDQLKQLLAALNSGSLPDVSLEDVLLEAVDLYRGEDFSGVELTANERGKDLVQLMSTEISQRRELDSIADDLILNQQKQLVEMQLVINEWERKDVVKTDITAALQAHNEALQTENSQYIQVNEALERQVKLLNKRQRFNWIDRPLIAVAVIGGFILGKEVAK